MSLLVLYTTHPSESCARDMSAALLQQGLIACANIYPIQSIYRWEGKVCEENEWVAIFKTLDKHFAEIESYFKAHHPYQTPCLVHWSAKANADYEDWVSSEAFFEK